MEVEEWRKMEKAWEHLNDVRWTQGGHRGRRGPNSNNVLHFIIECSNDSQDARHSILNFTRKKLALWFIGHEIVVGPPYVHLTSTAHDKVFLTFCCSFMFVNKCKLKKKGTRLVSIYTYMYSWLQTTCRIPTHTGELNQTLQIFQSQSKLKAFSTAWSSSEWNNHLC